MNFDADDRQPGQTQTFSGFPLAEFVRKLLYGELSRAEAVRVVAERWEEGTPHTFAAGRPGLSVASFEADFKFPDTPEFATLVLEDPRRLPQIEYRDP